MKTNWKIIFISLLIGGFLGSALTLGPARYGRQHGMYGKASHMRARMYKRLKLSPEQKTKVDAILKANREKLNKLSADTQPKMEALRAETRSLIRPLLTSEQQATFDKWEATREARRKERRARRDQLND